MRGCTVCVLVVQNQNRMNVCVLPRGSEAKRALCWARFYCARARLLSHTLLACLN